MRICANCKVELEKNMNFCPLCGEPVINNNTDYTEYIRIREQKQKILTDYQKLTSSEKRNLFWKISSIILFTGIVAIFVIDYIVSHSFTWSRYPVVVCLVLFINISLISFWHRKLFLLFLGSFISSSVLLLLFDFFNNGISWGIKLGISLLLSTYFIVFILILIIKHTKKRGLNIIALSFIAGGLLSICIEGIISYYSKKQLFFEWSVIVMASILLIVALLLFLHFRLKKQPDLKRFFHI